MTARQTLNLLGFVLLLAAAGCWGSATAPKSLPPPRAANAGAQQKATPAADATSERPGRASKVTDVATQSAESPSQQPSADAETAESPENPPQAAAAVSKERIVLLAPLNPFLIEFHFTIDGQPHEQALERLVDAVIKLADTDGDGRPMWAEVTSSKRFKYGQFGNLAINNDNDHKQIVERYDIDRDKVVDRDELPRFLTRNAGGSRSFSIRGTADYRGMNRRGAPTWQVIDTDGDGRISPEERQSAAGELRIRDSDDDEILVATDLNPRAALGDPGMMSMRRRAGPQAARLLGPHADWDNVRLALEHDYGGSRYLETDSFPLTPQLFTELDTNKDGRIDRTEIRGLDSVPPHMVIAVDFGKEPPKADASSPLSPGGRGVGGEGEVAVA
ncbi:MAG TPA: hypothetical protein VFV87_07220 [Pirellulaceae bacterium]|nr:hypothetical protein [Pirellulaceae bacterium]